MKLVKLIPLLILLVLLLSACQMTQPASSTEEQPYPETGEEVEIPYPDPTQEQAYPGPGQGANPQISNEIPWDQVEAMLLNGDVIKVMQTHDLKVYLTLKDESLAVTVEPEIDAIIKLLKECGDPCLYVAIATE